MQVINRSVLLRFLPPSRFWRPTDQDTSVPINISEFYTVMYIIHCYVVQKSPSLKVFACLRDLCCQCSQPLLSVSFKDITIPPFLRCDVGYEVEIVGGESRGYMPRCLFKLVEAELGPYRADTIEDRKWRTF